MTPVRMLIAVVAAGAVALAVYAGGRLVEVSEAYDDMADNAYLDAEGDAVEDARREAEDNRRRMAQAARGVMRTQTERRAAEPLLAELGDDGAPDARATDLQGSPAAADAQAGFEYAMGRVDRIVKSRRRLKVTEWDQLYREANDAFSALSIDLDAQDPEQAARLEDAHRRLKEGLRRVRVRGKRLAD